ncbi:TRAP transporter substrate-binding protein DctP [Candidatus Latescibacterota bacterium]
MTTSSLNSRGRALDLGVLAGLLLVLVLRGSTSAQVTQVIKLATLAPDGSSWVQSLRALDAEVREATGGAVGFKIYPGGVQGDEEVMLRKIRIGQLHGGGFGGLGVTQVLPDARALAIPFLFDGYDEVDNVLDSTLGYYQDGYEQAGFVLLGWLDVGFIYLLSRMPLSGADDIDGAKVWRLQGEPITGALFKKAGVTSVPLTIPDVLLGLQTKLVEVVYASPSAAIVLQWFTRVKYYTDLPINYTVGALLVDQRTFAKLSPDHQRIVRDVAGRHLARQRALSRGENEEALRVLDEEGLGRVAPGPAQIEEFRDLVQQCLPELIGEAFSRQSYDLVLSHLAAYRASASPPKP